MSCIFLLIHRPASYRNQSNTSRHPHIDGRQGHESCCDPTGVDYEQALKYWEIPMEPIFMLTSSSSSLRPSLCSKASKVLHPPSLTINTYSSAHANFHSKPLFWADIRWPIPPYMPSATTSTSQQVALLLPATTSQLKVKVSDKALPFGAIQVSMDDITDTIARYPGLKGAKLPHWHRNLPRKQYYLVKR